MDSEDVLGDDGRKALNACVKVRTYCVAQLQEYERQTALERLRGCYGGPFPRGFGSWLLFDPLKIYDVRNGHNISEVKRYSINVIYDALLNFDKVKYVEKYPNKEDPRREYLIATIDKRRDNVSREIEEAEGNPDGQRKYSWIVAQRIVRDCFAGNFAGDVGLLKQKFGERYSIIDIFNTVKAIDDEGQLLRYPEDKGDGSKELKNAIEANWEELTKEYEDAMENPCRQRKYSRSGAERRVRDCFAGTLKEDTDIFPNVRNSREATFNVFDIKSAIDNFDEKKLIDKYPKPGRGEDEKRKNVDDQRAGILTEYEKTIKLVTISYGTGFLIGNGLAITNEHVIRRYLNDEERYGLFVSNELIHCLPTEVVFVDDKNDLALLHCPNLNLNDTEIGSFNLCGVDLLVGQSVFCFGYPPTHRGETALFVEGKVAGYKKELHKEPLVTLNCSLRSGCSGGPVMRRIKGQIVVLGVVRELHKQDIFEENERNFMENMNKQATNLLLQVVLKFIKPLIKLVFKLHYALNSTHSPFNFINVIPARKVKKLLQDIEVKMARVAAL
ncbi:hypothetical protein pdam_00012003 [Pocillopora damicornis]|uniref:Serine protease n=1 Tax=Pocillopora damicornis TaxID=46731 RepID=A0A3M6TI10_POCDA|nr:uncharacterized protein LOC113677462 [Pocillopora damicornis]RMX40898.1 hypothetical protein pdam_00012003 [Pocillopora damicornis]